MPRILVSLFAFAAALLCPAFASADPCREQLPRTPDVHISGVVRYVVDGDTLCIGDANARSGALTEVRLADFNAFLMLRGSNGVPGRMALSDLRDVALNHPIECITVRGPHRDVRLRDEVYALCSIDGEPVGDLMREAGAPERRHRR